jgi:orotate phosphoribosyltransferase
MVNYGTKLAKIMFGMEATMFNDKQPFLWASGFWMPIYNDNRLFLSDVKYRELIAEGFADTIKKEKIKIDAIAGTSTAGIPHGATLANLLRVPFTYIRDKPKEHGLKNRIEGLPASKGYEGARVGVVEDLISTGGSSAGAVDAVRKAGGIADHLFSIYNYGLEEANNMFDGVIAFGKEAETLNPRVNVHSLLSYQKSLEVAVKTGYISKKQQQMLEEWRADPFGWGRKHGYHWLRGADEKKLSESEQKAKARVCLAVDVPNTRDAFAYADGFSDLIGLIKIGKATNQAAVNEGVPLLRKLHQTGMGVFLDLKLKDTPDQVYLAAKQCTVPGVQMFNVHVDGGEKMCKEAVRGATEAAAARGIPKPKVIGVTVLTSLDENDLTSICVNEKYEDHVFHMAKRAKQWGLDGIVCPASLAGKMEKKFGRWEYVTPGVKFAGVQNVGQKQLDTPDGAVQACKSSTLVIGSAVTKAPDRRKTAYEILQVMAPHV